MAVAWAERWQIAPGPMRTVRGSLRSHGSGNRKGWAVATGKARAPNLVLRYIRETERRESREEFAAAIVNAGRELGDNHLACDARLVARWEDGDVECPRPAYQRALTALTGRPFRLLGFRSRNAIELPSTDDLAPGRLSALEALRATGKVGQSAEPTLPGANPVRAAHSNGSHRGLLSRSWSHRWWAMPTSSGSWPS